MWYSNIVFTTELYASIVLHNFLKESQKPLRPDDLFDSRRTLDMGPCLKMRGFLQKFQQEFVDFNRKPVAFTAHDFGTWHTHRRKIYNASLGCWNVMPGNTKKVDVLENLWFHGGVLREMQNAWHDLMVCFLTRGWAGDVIESSFW